MAEPQHTPDPHLDYIRMALNLAEQSPPKPTNFRVGAVLVDSASNIVLSTGYTLELPGNTHAEQCCLTKLAEDKQYSLQSEADCLPDGTVLYTTMEPCIKRLSGNTPCVDRILATRKGRHGGIKTLYIGVEEPSTFVGENRGRDMLEAAGIKVVRIDGLRLEILKVATLGHKQAS
ncbi:hypothetical protein MMC25_008174 [Agyrium rufum]|nr:hypothetical protein [Agyrium rufum]